MLHQLKGTASTLGGMALAAQARALEHQLQSKGKLEGGGCGISTSSNITLHSSFLNIPVPLSGLHNLRTPKYSSDVAICTFLQISYPQLYPFYPMNPTPTPTLMSADTATKTILIAEDSSVILNLTRKILELQKYKIVLAKNGGEVLKQLESNPIDCVLMDINIPVKDGMQCTREIRAHADPKINKPCPSSPSPATPTTTRWTSSARPA